MAFGSARGGAPGTYIYESAVAAQAGRASFNTTYMVVSAPAETSVTVFPFNRPIAISSLNEYENLIGILPTIGGPELTSYYAVKAFFQQAVNADLRVTRVGTPGVIQELAFSPSANKDNGVAIPSALKSGDLVYAKLQINGKELGDRTAAGAWLGVPVTIPADYIDGDTDNNLVISTAMRDAVVAAIEADADISSGAYIREVGTGDPACDECAYMYLTGRVFNSQVEIIESSSITSNQFVFATSAYDISNVTDADASVYDYIQCVRTAFEDAKLPQGYLTAPAAFTQYEQTDRVNLGQSMEEVCSDMNHKWVAMIDCGPYTVTDINTYSDYLEHSAADGFETGEKPLIENVIYEWTDTNNLAFTQARYEEGNEFASTNPSLSDGDRRALKDDRLLSVSTAASALNDTLTLTSDFPSALATGERITIAASVLASDPQPTPPTYSDVYTSVTAQSLVGAFYVIAQDTDSSLADNEIKLATSRVRALSGDNVDILTGGTPQSGALLDLEYSTVSWEIELEIKGKTSNLIEVNNNEGASFNSLHFPGTLQKRTAEYDFQSQVRQLTDPSQTIISGGASMGYFGSAAVSAANDTIIVSNHGLNTGDEVKVWQLPSATVIGALNSGEAVFAIKVDDNTIALAATQADADTDTRITFTDAGTDSTSVVNPLGAPAQAVITTGGDALVFSADHGLNTGDRILLDNDITYTNSAGTDFLFQGTDADDSTEYYAYKVDRNFILTTPSASNLAAEVFKDFPLPVAPAVTAINTTTPVRIYRKVTVAEDGGQFSDTGLLRFLRGRKYQMDVTLGIFNVKDEAGVGIQTGIADPYGVNYTADLSTDLRLSRSSAPVGVATYKVAAPAAGSNITVTAHGYVLGQEVKVEEAADATLDTGLSEGITYFVTGTAGVVAVNDIQLALTLSDAVAGTSVALNGDGVNNASGISLGVTSASNPYDFSYTEDENAYPLNNTRDFAGDNNFYTVPLSSGIQSNSSFKGVFFHLVLEESELHTTLFNSYLEIEFVESNATPPNSLWNFDTVTSADLMGEALRGVNNNGTPQAIVLEKGMDSHTRLFEESQKYSTTQGFLAYFAPYILNDVGVYIPPTPFVTGLAMRRYRDEVAGFRLPPAGAKYNLAGARGVQVEITGGQQNVSNPYGLNALRQLPGYSETDADTGITYGPVFVWGSRTRINPANAEQALYKFVNTRVIINVIYGTLRYAFDNQIFSIVDGRAVTFNQIRTIAANTLYEQFYVPGALFGSTAADAFDVICDDRNNPSGNLENGLVNVQIFCVPVPTLERIEIDLVRVAIGQISAVETQLGYL